MSLVLGKLIKSSESNFYSLFVVSQQKLLLENYEIKETFKLTGVAFNKAQPITEVSNPIINLGLISISPRLPTTCNRKTKICLL